MWIRQGNIVKGNVKPESINNFASKFTSVFDGVNWAIAIKQQLSELNSSLPAERKMQFSIGVNLRDVVEEGVRIYGYGVNFANRI